MSHRISIEAAKEKFEWEKHCQELNRAGLPTDRISRYAKKQNARLSKTERFIEMLKNRGGYYKQKEKEEKKDEAIPTRTT